VPERATVEVDGRRLSLSNLDKVLYPDGFTKGEVVDYYARIAPVLLPYVEDRPMSFQRFPDGTAKQGFFAKKAPQGTPDWVRTVTLPAPGTTKTDRETLDYVVVGDLPTLVWAANLAALELHVPQWPVGPRGGARDPDRLVLDLDPGEPATAVECAEVAMLLRELVVADGLDPVVKSSGSKGIQVYASIEPASDRRTSDYARHLAQRLETSHPKLVVSQMRKDLRRGKVFVDWSQNNAAKTTVAPYALRARPEPWVSTPLTWDEVAAVRSPDDVRFQAGQVLERVVELGDLFGPLLEPGRPLPE
jgi:bifunctional non-homologous end joining protein LigD